MHSGRPIGPADRGYRKPEWSSGLTRVHGHVLTVSGLTTAGYEGGGAMKAARRLPVVDRRITTALAIGYLVLAPVSAIATNSDAVGAVPTASVQQVRHHQGLDYWANRRRPRQFA